MAKSIGQPEQPNQPDQRSWQTRSPYGITKGLTKKEAETKAKAFNESMKAQGATARATVRFCM